MGSTGPFVMQKCNIYLEMAKLMLQNVSINILGSKYSHYGTVVHLNMTSHKSAYFSQQGRSRDYLDNKNKKIKFYLNI